MKRKKIKVPPWPHEMPYETFLGLVIHAGLGGIKYQDIESCKFIHDHGYRAFRLCWNKPVIKIRKYYKDAVDRYKNLEHWETVVYREGVNNWRKSCGFVYAALCVAYDKMPPKEFQDKAQTLVKAILNSAITECPPEPPTTCRKGYLKLVTKEYLKLATIQSIQTI